MRKWLVLFLRYKKSGAEGKLETGLQIMAPLFIATGETVRVETATRKYAGRENA